MDPKSKDVQIFKLYTYVTFKKSANLQICKFKTNNEFSKFQSVKIIASNQIFYKIWKGVALNYSPIKEFWLFKIAFQNKSQIHHRTMHCFDISF